MKKPHNLLEAINDLDDNIIEDALAAPVIPFKKRKVFRLAVVAAIIASLGITVYAVNSLGLWYQNYFADHLHSEITPQQATFLEENVIPVEDAHQPGITLESALTDGVVIYMKLHVTGPEGVTLLPWDEDRNRGLVANNGFYSEKFNVGSDEVTDVVTIEGKKVYNGLRFIPMEDGDGNENTMDYMATGMLEAPWDETTGKEIPLDLPGKTLDIRIQDFYQLTSEEDYSNAQIEKILSGEWNFEVPITEKGLETRELLSEPVISSLEYLDMEAEEKTFRWQEDIPITGITMRALSMDVRYDWPHNSGNPGEIAWAVMKDGSKVRLITQYGGQGMVQYHAGSPIVLNNLDHVEFKNGLVVPAPES